MKKSFLKGASIFLASVLTVGMCSAYVLPHLRITLIFRRIGPRTQWNLLLKIILSQE